MTIKPNCRTCACGAACYGKLHSCSEECRNKNAYKRVVKFRKENPAVASKKAVPMPAAVPVPSHILRRIDGTEINVRFYALPGLAAAKAADGGLPYFARAKR